VLLGYFYTIANFTDSAAFLTVFDQYRIKELSVTWYPQVKDNFIAAGTVATVVPTKIYNLNVLTTCIDNDDATNPASENVVLNHETAITHGPFDRPVTRTFLPMVADTLYQGAFTGFGAEANRWIDSVSTGVQHYGVKYAVVGGTTMSAGLVNMLVYVKARVEFRKHF